MFILFAAYSIYHSEYQIAADMFDQTDYNQVTYIQGILWYALIMESPHSLHHSMTLSS